MELLRREPHVQRTPVLVRQVKDWTENEYQNKYIMICVDLFLVIIQNTSDAIESRIWTFMLDTVTLEPSEIPGECDDGR